MIRPLEKLIAVKSRAFKVMFIVALVCCAAAASAADWQWPTEMTVAGLKIMEIRGTTNNDGSGTGSGKLMVPGAPGQKISLKRSSRGEITGSSSIKLRMSGAEVDGDFILNNSGLKGRGTAKFSPRSVEDCSMTISPDGLVKGTGKVSLGNCAAAANFSVSKRDADLNGSTSARAQA